MAKGRAEAALDRELRGEDSIGQSERAALRICARALDGAERGRNGQLVADLSKTYLDLRMAAGLSRNSPAKPADDPFDVLAAALTAPALGDTPVT
jgi:hypothetical protein